MLIVFRVDSADFMGIGHVMRCMTLAAQLKKNNYDILFISKDLPGNINHKIIDQGFRLEVITGFSEYNSDSNHRNWLGTTEKSDFEKTWKSLSKYRAEKLEWVIVDHYGLGALWEQQFLDKKIKVLAIDDLASRRHVSNILLDQTFSRDISDYEGLISDETMPLLGAKFALLRDEFSKVEDILSFRKNHKSSEEIILLVMMGGTDTRNITFDVLTALDKLYEINLKINVVLGGTCPHVTSLKGQFGNCENINFFVDVTDIGQLMLEADLSIGAAGTSSWERCALGLPTLLYVIAENQIKIAENLIDFGAARMLTTPITAASILNDLNSLLDEKSYYHAVESCLKVTNGKGASQVAKIMMGI